ncbi:MAG: hypothetical protein GX348_03615, partial [Veillonellaceae bacterium]|nr:hypothetical protein [Veillonellaceae bacterium]
MAIDWDDPEIDEWEDDDDFRPEIDDYERQLVVQVGCFPRSCNPRFCFPRSCFPRACFPRRQCFPR